MDHRHSALLHYIQSHRQHGASLDQIRQDLLNGGWQSEVIEQAIQHLGLQPTPPPATDHNQPLPQHRPTDHITQADHYQDQPADQAGPSARYGFFQSITETFQAIRNNPSAIIFSLLIGIGLIVAVPFAMAPLLGLIYGNTALIGGKLAGTIVAAYVILALANLAAQSFTATLLVMAYSDGIRRQRQPIGKLLLLAGRRILRVTVTTALTTLIIFGPLIVAFFIQLSAISSLRSDEALQTLTIVFVIGVVGVIWAIVCLLRLALTLHIAVLEPTTPLLQIPKRSSFLLRQGGQWFVFKCFVLFVAIGSIGAVIVDSLTGSPADDATELSNGAALWIIIVCLVAFGSLTMLYRNRAAVRGQQPS